MMSKNAPKRVTSADVKALLRSRFPKGEWALAFEVADATGGRGRRLADAVAMNMWPSRGLAIHGFEIKVSKTDWKKELLSPEKAEAVSKYCDHWWIVAPQGIVCEDDVPATWGYLEIRDGQLVQVKAAPLRDAEPVTKEFMAALFRRVGAIDEEEVEATVRLRLAAADAAREKDFERRVQARLYRYEGLDRAIAEYEKHSGLNFREYAHLSDELGKAVRLVMDSGVFGSFRTVEGLRRMMLESASQIEAAIGKYGESEIHPVQRELENMR
jgi:hypothetical protein